MSKPHHGKKQRPTRDHQGGKPSRARRWEGGKTSEPNGFYITGLNGVRECLASPHVRVKSLWQHPKATHGHEEILADWSGKIETAEVSPHGPLDQGIGVLVKPPNWPMPEDILDAVKERGEKPLIVVLDGVSDPMNLGQILRTCECAGVHAVILPKHRSVHLNQTVAQVSQGAFAWTPLIEVTNIRNTLDMMKEQGLWVVGCEALPQSKNWADIDFTEPTALVMGSEGAGLRDLTRKTCDHLAALPLKGRINSLNVSAATSAFLFEILRQRM